MGQLMNPMLSPLQVDVLREISNIGCGNAATALSQMLNKRVEMTIPDVRLLPLAEVPDSLGGAELLLTGVYLQVFDEMPSSILFLLEQESVNKLLSMLLGTADPVALPLTPMQQSALMEVGNILSSAYLGALSGFTNLQFKLSVPALATDMAGAILDIALMQLGEYTDQALIIENTLCDGDESVQANFLLLPERLLLERIFQVLGVTE